MKMNQSQQASMQAPAQEGMPDMGKMMKYMIYFSPIMMLFFFNNYASSFLNSRELLKRYIVNYSNSSGRIAVFGAGHISVMFINLMEIKDSIEFVVDDDSNKQGFYIPGTNIPIKPSNFLVTKGIKLCLLGLSPESEKKVINSNNEFTSKGGKFLSIFPNRRNSIQAIV